MPPISINILTKNCPTSLDECLTSLKPFLLPGDEIIVVDTGSTDLKTIPVAESHGARVFSHPELNVAGMLDLVKTTLSPEHYEECIKDTQFSDGFLADFAAARTIAESHSTHDTLFWIDSDDVLVGGDRLRPQIEEFFKDPAHNLFFLPYEYSFDPIDGSCNTLLWRERVYRKNHYHWMGKCHEALLPNTPSDLQLHRLEDSSICIRHKNSRHHRFSDIRNYAILKTAYDTEEWKDPRTEFYLGNACRGLNDWNQAIKWYALALVRSGSRDDRLTCILNLGYGYLQFNRPWKAMDWFLQATKIWAEEPRAYFGIAKCHFDLRNWKNCLIWTQIGLQLPTPPHITAVDPLSFTFYPHVFEVLALQKLNNLDAALKVCQQLIQMRPNFKPSADLLQEMIAAKGGEIVKDSISTVLQLAFSPQAQREIAQRIKPEVRKQIPMLQVEAYCTKPEKSVTFFCGKTIEPWDGTSLTKGVGGSEKMVIQLGESLARRGWKIDVYGHPYPENAYKSFAGVTYRPVESFDIEHTRDILVLWRSLPLLDAPWKARRILVDLHDVPNPAELNEARTNKASAFVFKSAYHRSLVPALPDAKAAVLRNAIDLKVLQSAEEKLAGAPRDYHKIVWTSSADRGLRAALLAYAKMKGEFTDSSFHVFYGFTPLYLEKAASQSYQHFSDCGCDRHMLDYSEECFELMDRLGATLHGRIGTEALYTELLTAGVWLYPTGFPEISCISAMEAQACGVFPLCSDYAALAETVSFGSFIPTGDLATISGALRGVLTKGKDLDTYRAEMAAASRVKFDLETLTTQWEELFDGKHQ